jgi:hypothetical protein
VVSDFLSFLSSVLEEEVDPVAVSACSIGGESPPPDRGERLQGKVGSSTLVFFFPAINVSVFCSDAMFVSVCFPLRLDWCSCVSTSLYGSLVESFVVAEDGDRAHLSLSLQKAIFSSSSSVVVPSPCDFYEA